MTNRKLQYAPFLLLFSPLIFSFDGDRFRAWEVAAVGLAFLAFSYRWVGTWRLDPVLWAGGIFGLVVVLQQPFVYHGSLAFGAKYAGIFMLMFFPGVYVASRRWSMVDFEASWDRAILALTIIVVANYGLSLMLGVGQIYSTATSSRSFGFLGDSFTPVLNFLILYFCIQRRWAWALVVTAALLITGGKAAIVMLLLGGAIYYGVFGSLKIRLLAIVAAGVAVVLFASPALTFLRTDAVIYSWNTRLLSYRIGMRLFLDNPLTGVGINGSMKYLHVLGAAEADARGVTKIFGVYQIHNSFVRTLAETGVAGFTAFCVFCVVIVGRALRMFWVAHAEAPSRARALALASGVWVISFVTFYQSVGWFEQGHPQLAWLLLISGAGLGAARTLARRRGQLPLLRVSRVKALDFLRNG